MSFWSEYGLVVGFYVGLIILIYLNRQKFEWQGKIIAILRTNTGLRWMQHYGERHQKLVRRLGSIGVIVGFIGMMIIAGYLVYGLYTTFFVPGSPPVISPVLPGVKIPGTGIHVPLFEGLLALFVVILVHEAAHGLVGSSYGLKIKSSGLVLFGPIPGAFVEPDEEELPKKPIWQQLSVFAAGPWSNIILAIIAFLAVTGLGLAMAPLTDNIGVSFSQVQEGSPAELAGLPVNTTFTSMQGEELTHAGQIAQVMGDLDPGDELTLGTQTETYAVTLGAYDPSPGAPQCIGIGGLQTEMGPGDYRESKPVLTWFVFLLNSVLFWIFALSLGLGLANLLPVGPIDGGRMIQLVFRKWFGEQRGDNIWKKMSILLFGVLIILLVVPIMKAIFTAPVVAQCLPI